MKAQDLKNSILQLAMEGKLVPQNPNNVPAKKLLAQIQKEKEQLIKDKKIKRNNKESIIFRDNGHFYEKVGKKGEPVCIDDEIPFEIPESWEFSRLGNIISISSGDGLTSNNMNKNGTIPVYGGNGITGFHNKYNINKKTLIIGRVGFHCGNAHISEKKAWVTDNAFITTFPEKYINFYFLELLITFSNLKKYSSSTAQPVVSGKKIYPILVPIPPLEEQKRIVKKIEELLPYVEEYGKAEEKLEELNETFPEKIKASILQEAVKGNLVPQNLDDVPAKELLSQIQKEKEQLIKDKKIKRNNKESIIFRDNGHFYEKVGKKGEPVCIDDEIPFDIPDSWGLLRLDDVGVYKKGPFGSNLTKSMFIPKSESSIKVYEQKNAINKDFSLGNYYISLKYFKEKMQGFEVKSGDIIVSCAGTIGETYVLPKNIEKGIINQALMRMNIVPSINLDYFLLYFDYILKESAKKASKGSAIKNIPPFKVFKKLILPIPPLEEQKRIVEKIEQLFEICENLII